MPPDQRLPDVLIIGDSHSNALAAGCEAHGLITDMLRFSGNFWHAGYIKFHPKHGIWIRGSADQQKQIVDLRARLGGRSVISADVPIIAAMGFHLGRIVPPFGFNNHVTQPEAFAKDDTRSYASHALVQAYVEHARSLQIRLARRMSRFGNMTLVTPPNFFPGSNYETFSDVVGARLQAAGVRVFDPRADLCASGQALAAEYLAADRVHGNERYGAEVIGLMIARGFVGKRVGQ